MKLLSSNLSDSSDLPKEYTCDGKGTSPNFFWSDFPSETKSFAFIMEDPDAPAGTYIHWLAINMPLSITSIKEGFTTISEAEMISNTSGKVDYVPPCPPTGSHSYIFKVFALSIEKIDRVNKDNFYEKIKPYVLDQTEIRSKYKR